MISAFLAEAQSPDGVQHVYPTCPGFQNPGNNARKLKRMDFWRKVFLFLFNTEVHVLRTPAGCIKGVMVT